MNKKLHSKFGKGEFSMKKVLFLILYLICFLLTCLFASTTFLGINSSAYMGSIILLAILTAIFLTLTILLFKAYKKAKEKK